MANTKEFKEWHRMETMRRLGVINEIDHAVERELSKIKLEVRIDGVWTEVKESQLVDDPNDFRVDMIV